MTVVIFIIVLAILILIHEFGHFIVAKKSGIRVDEFGLGFPPRITGKQIGETFYSINWLPFGGFVKIFGEDPSESDINTDNRESSFVYKSKWIQAAVIVAGVVFNWIFAALLLIIAFTSGVPAAADAFPDAAATNPRVVITYISADSPAEEAGFMLGDELVSLTSGETSVQITQSDEVSDHVSTRVGQAIEAVVNRSGDLETLSVVPKQDTIEERALIGIGMEQVADIKLPIHKAFVAGITSTWGLTKQTVSGLWGLIAGMFDGSTSIDQVSGPVGIATFVGAASREGLASLLFLMALISVNLAVINLFPFPALDGGRLLFIIIERIKGSPIRREVANNANLIGFFLLIGLLLVVTYHDIIKLF